VPVPARIIIIGGYHESERWEEKWWLGLASSRTFGTYIAYICRIFSMRDKRAKFVELANRRVNRAIEQLRLVGNLANKSAYEYTDDDARKIAKALQKACDSTKARFLGTAEGGDKPFSL
jgi:hypothetical protein